MTMESRAVSIHGCHRITMSTASMTTITVKLHPPCPSNTVLGAKSLSISTNFFVTPCLPTKTVSASAAKPGTPRHASRSAREAAIRDLQQSSDLSNALARSGDILKVADLNIVLRNFGSSSRWKHISQLFEWMQNNGKINVASYSSYIKFMGESKDISKAINVYDAINDVMKSSISICNSVLCCLVKNNKFGKARSMFEHMKHNGLQPDVVTYSTLLAGCLKVENGYVKAQELVKELEKKGILMDTVAYGTLMAICASNRRCEEAEMYFIRMQAEGHSPNAYHYSSLLNAYSWDGNYQKADELVQDMASTGVMPNKVILTTLLKVYVRAGLFEKSQSLLSKLESLGYTNDEMPYCILMDGLSKLGKIHEAKLTFDLMKKRHVKSEGYSHSIMISAFCRAGQLEEAKKFARDYEALYNKFDLFILNVLLCAYCRAGDMDYVMQTLRKMDKLAIKPDQTTFGILIKYFCKEKLYLLAYRTLQDMINKGHQLEEEALFSLLLQLGKVGAYFEAFSVYKILASSKTSKCKTIHEEILNVLVVGEHWENALVIVKDKAQIMSPESVRNFLAVFTRSGNVNLMNDVVEAVHGSGHKIDQDVFNQIISCYVAQQGKVELLIELLQWMPSHGYLVDPSTRCFILKNAERNLLITQILAKQQSIASTSKLC